MERTEQNLKVLTAVMATLLLLCVAGGIYYWDKSQDLTKEKSKIEQQANLQLSARSRENNNLNNQLATAKKENQSLTGKMQEANNLLSQKDNKLQELATSNAYRMYRLKALRDTMQLQVTDLAALRSQSEGLTENKESLTIQNTELSNQVTSLNEQLQTMVPRNTLTGDGFRVVAIKQNDKETAKAKKVHTLSVSFTIPSELGLSGTQEVYLSLTDLQGNVFMTPLRTATVASLNKTFPVHAVKSMDFSKDLQRVAFTMESVEDVKPGTYRASVYTKDNYLGSAEFAFRDSFWFF